MKLIVLDYSDGTVNIHDISDNNACGEELLEQFGYKETNCSWMIGDNIKIHFHNNQI